MINLVFNSFRDKKKYTLYLMLLIICLSIILIFSSARDYYKDKLDVTLNQIENRKIIVLNRDYNTLDNLKKIKYIDDIIPSPIIDTFYNDNNYIIEPFIEKNYNVSKALKKNEVILPFDNKDEIKLEIMGEQYELKVKNYSTSIDAIYVSLDLFEELSQKNDLPIEKYILLANDYTYVDSIIKILDEKQYIYYTVNSRNDLERLDGFIKFIEKFIYFIIVCFSILLYLTVKSIVKNEIKDISIFNVVGYNNFILTFILFLRIVILLLISVLFSLLLFVISILFLNCFIENSMYIIFLLKLNFITDYLKYIGIIFLILLFSPILLFFKINKINALNEINDE